VGNLYLYQVSNKASLSPADQSIYKIYKISLKMGRATRVQHFFHQFGERFLAGFASTILIKYSLAGSDYFFEHGLRRAKIHGLYLGLTEFCPAEPSLEEKMTM